MYVSVCNCLEEQVQYTHVEWPRSFHDIINFANTTQLKILIYVHVYAYVLHSIIHVTSQYFTTLYILSHYT